MNARTLRGMPPATPPRDALRLFLGLWPCDATRDALVSYQARWAWPRGVALVRAEKLHLTLHFLGDVLCDRLPALQVALAHVPAGGFQLPWTGSERWGGGLAVLRTAESPALDVLHAQLGEVLRQQELPVETRAFKPHVTLARKATGVQPPAQPPAGAWVSEGFVLVASVDGRYEVLSRHGQRQGLGPDLEPGRSA